MVLGAIGLYGVVPYLVTGRSRVFAIQLAQGARPSALRRLVPATGGWVVALGVGTGAVLAFVATCVVARIVSFAGEDPPTVQPPEQVGAILA